MKTVILDGAAIPDRAALHQTLAEKLDFPDWYGGNLDALFDCLTSLPEDVELTVQNGAALEEALGTYAGIFFRVLTDAAEETGRFTVTLE